MAEPKPEVRTLTVRVRRVVNLGKYASFELVEEIQAQPDPDFNTAQNLTRLREGLIKHVDEACDAIAATIKEDS
jgi:hypothetical protein